MAGGSNSKRRVSRDTGSGSSNTQPREDIIIIEGNNHNHNHNHNLQARVQERAADLDQHFFDGIPCFADVCFLHKSSSISKEMSLLLRRAGTVGCGMVLGTIGSSITSLNAGSGFASGAAKKGSGIAILAFEAANTIVKGFNLLQSPSPERIRHLKEEVLLSEAVQNIVSEDMDELLRIVAADKRLELKVFTDEVIRFGNRSKDIQWRRLDRYFEMIISRGLIAERPSRDEAESIMQQLMTLVHFTAELYHELNAWDKLQQDFQRKCEEEDQTGDSLALLRVEIKSQIKLIRHLKKKSLWSRSLEEVVEKLVDIVLFLRLEISNAFGNADDHEPLIGHISNCQRLGLAGLAVHYANIVVQIDNLVDKSTMPANTKDALYQSLPPNVKLSLRSKLLSHHVVEELSVANIKNEMQKILHWLVPMATNTSKARHRFGWLGEWANTGSEENRKTFQAGVMQIETFHHADKEKVEYYIIELLIWLHRLAIRSKAESDSIAG